MLIIPAIDLMDGCVVRLVQGRRDKKVYSRHPLKTARHWAKQGAEFLHLVDLDGAFTGKLKNLNPVKQIVNGIDIPVEFGGGVRDLKTIKMLLELGVGRVVLGTKAIEDRAFLKSVFGKFKHKIIISLDVKAGALQVKGWKAKTKKPQSALGFACELRDMGFKELIYTDISKDGTLQGPNIKEIKELLNKVKIKIIASGGVSSLEDIYKLKKIERSGLSGVIVGKALYEGRFTLAEALKFA